MKIKKSQLALGLTALTIVSSLGISSATLAAGPKYNENKASSNAWHLREGSKGTKPVLTDAQKAAMDAKKTTMTTKKAAIVAALKANDYNAWVTAVGANAPILQKINATNFSSYVQFYNLRIQEEALATQLGLGNNGHGMGVGLGLNK